MKSRTFRWLATTCTACFASGGMAGAAGAAERQVAHMVYFQLKDQSDESKEKFLASCKKYLDGHTGVVHFSVGIRIADLDREVNDQTFDISLNVVFKNRAAHDQYQVNPRHLKFIAENKDLWQHVRVFDSYLAP